MHDNIVYVTPINPRHSIKPPKGTALKLGPSDDTIRFTSLANLSYSVTFNVVKVRELESNYFEDAHACSHVDIKVKRPIDLKNLNIIHTASTQDLKQVPRGYS